MQWKLWSKLIDRALHTAQKMKFSIKDFFSKCDQIRGFLRICSHLLKKYVMENFMFRAVATSSSTSFVAKMNIDKYLKIS